MRTIRQAIRRARSLLSGSPGSLTYRCNICGSLCQSPASGLQRETPSCHGCGSTPRYRAVIRVLSEELFGRSLALPDFPVRRDLVGIGLSDWDGYAGGLREKFSYINTYFHQEPVLDITAGDSARRHSLDFLISSEVFEHVAPPVSLAFSNAQKLLKPGGIFVLTVPYTLSEGTTEHFPDLYKYALKEKAGRHVLENINRSGQRQEYADLAFHGGDGFSLEMRVFSEKAILDHLREAGFDRVKIYRDPDYVHGVLWEEPWSLPIAARSA